MNDSLYELETIKQCISRINNIQKNDTPQWGKMTAAQMFAHCSEVQEVCNGKPLHGTTFFLKLLKPVIRKFVVNTSPYPKSSKTHPAYLQVDQKEFEKEKIRLIEAIESFQKSKEKNSDSIQHPFFGKMSKAEAGWAMYKHLNHHLEQFGQ